MLQAPGAVQCGGGATVVLEAERMMMMVVMVGTPDLKDDFHCYCWRKKVPNRQKARQKLLSLLSKTQQNHLTPVKSVSVAFRMVSLISLTESPCSWDSHIKNKSKKLKWPHWPQRLHHTV